MEEEYPIARPSDRPPPPGIHPLPAAERAALEAYLRARAAVPAEPPPASLGEYLVSADDARFHRELFKFIQADGRPERDIYLAVGLDRRRFSRIRSDRAYRPDKLTVLSFAFVLHLNIGQVEDLLRAAGLALSPTTTFDLIVRYYLERGDVNVFHVNDALYDYRQPLLCGVAPDYAADA